MNATTIENELEWQNAFYLVEQAAKDKGMGPSDFAQACLDGIKHHPQGIRGSIGFIRHQADHIAQDLPEAAEGLRVWLRQHSEEQ